MTTEEGVYAPKRDRYEPCTMDEQPGEDKKQTENITRRETKLPRYPQ